MQLSAQETFDRTLAMMRAQGKPAMDETTLTCKYRLKSGDKVLKCAAGHWIPDELYRNSLEYNGSLSCNNALRTLLSCLPYSPDSITLIALQRVHDATALRGPRGMSPPLPGTEGVIESIRLADSWLVNMERAAAIVAKNLGLNYSAPE